MSGDTGQGADKVRCICRNPIVSGEVTIYENDAKEFVQHELPCAFIYLSGAKNGSDPESRGEIRAP